METRPGPQSPSVRHFKIHASTRERLRFVEIVRGERTGWVAVPMLTLMIKEQESLE